MEVIADELQKNNADIDMAILLQQINYENVYGEMAGRLGAEELVSVFAAQFASSRVSTLFRQLFSIAVAFRLLSIVLVN